MRSRWLLYLSFFALGALQYAIAPNVWVHSDDSSDRKLAETPVDERPEDAQNDDSEPIVATEVAVDFEPGVVYETLEPRKFIFAADGANADEPRPAVVPLANDVLSSREAAQCSHWARFPVGSWARLRAVGISYENGKPVQSVTETKITLLRVDLDARRYTLEYESTIKLGVVDYPKRSERMTYDFCDVPVDDSTKIEDRGAVGLAIGSKTIPCRERRVVRKTNKLREMTTIWYSPAVAPYLFQRETYREPLDANDATESAPSRELFVAQRSAPGAVDTLTRANYVARSTSVSGRRRRSSTIVYSVNIPGGVLRENAVETRFDDSATVFQLDSALLDYYIAR